MWNSTKHSRIINSPHTFNTCFSIHIFYWHNHLQLSNLKFLNYPCSKIPSHIKHFQTSSVFPLLLLFYCNFTRNDFWLDYCSWLSPVPLASSLHGPQLSLHIVDILVFQKHKGDYISLTLTFLIQSYVICNTKPFSMMKTRYMLFYMPEMVFPAPYIP